MAEPQTIYPVDDYIRATRSDGTVYQARYDFLVVGWSGGDQMERDERVIRFAGLPTEISKATLVLAALEYIFPQPGDETIVRADGQELGRDRQTQPAPIQLDITPRAMQKWEKAIDRDALSRMIAEEAKRKLPQSQEAALQQVAEGLIPVLWRAKDAGEDLERQGWFWLFGVMERQLGSEKFERFVSEYMSWRSGSATRVEPGLQQRSGDEGTHQEAR